nr:LuxR C-terminal-related transcriptional regulator [Allomuricauda sp.]
MRALVIFLIFLTSSPVLGQYRFSGDVGVQYSGNPVYLSLVEDYRKSSRVYSNQIIKQGFVNEEGSFVFEGDNLATANRIYRVHVDECPPDSISNKHFLRDCHNNFSRRFIAKGTDTLHFPLIPNDQPFCEIETTNSKSGLILEFENLKERMILDFMDYDSQANESLNFEKWFGIFQQFGEHSEEPLVELLVYDFLSDRRNETYEHYLSDLESNPYYSSLLQRLFDTYPSAPFTKQYQMEFRADQLLAQDKLVSENDFPIHYIAYALLAVLLFLSARRLLKNRDGKVAKMAPRVLTPQELKIFNAIREGQTNKEIASSLFISVSTVKTHINSIYKKLDLESRNEIK